MKRYSVLICSLCLFFFSCKKDQIKNNDGSLNSDEVSRKISEDPLFSEYISGIIMLIDKGRNSSSNLSETEFKDNFKNAVINSDMQSKKIIATEMGFEFYDLFWIERDKMNYALNTLSIKYDLKKINEIQWKNLITDKILVLKNTSKITRVIMSFDNSPLCVEKYWNCMDQAAATYVFEQVTCVTVGGSIGWTGIGFLAFVGCESASQWHLNSMRKGCDIDFRMCSKK